MLDPPPSALLPRSPRALRKTLSAPRFASSPSIFAIPSAPASRSFKPQRKNRDAATPMSWKDKIDYLRGEIFIFLDYPKSSRVAFAFSVFMTILIVYSTIVYMVLTLPEYYDGNTALEGTEIFCISIFTLELVLRLSCCSHFTRYIQQPAVIIDILAVIPYYIDLGVGSETDFSFGLIVIRMLRVLRVFRVLKIGKYSKSLSVLLATVRICKEEFVMLFFIFILSVVIFASCIFYAEQSVSKFDREIHRWVRDDGNISPFQSIFHSLWFTVVSMTTVGYGDVVPRSLPGKIVAGVILLMGTFILIFPSTMFGAHLVEVRRTMDVTARTLTQLTEQPSNTFTQEIRSDVLKHSHLPQDTPRGEEDEGERGDRTAEEGGEDRDDDAGEKGRAREEEDEGEREMRGDDDDSSKSEKKKKKKKKRSDLSYSEEIAMEVFKHSHHYKKEKEKEKEKEERRHHITPHMAHIVEELIAERSLIADQIRSMEHALQHCRRRHAKLGLLVASITSDEEGGSAILENYEGIENLARGSLRLSTEFHHAHGDSRAKGTHAPLSRVGSTTHAPLSRVGSTTHVPPSRANSGTHAPLTRVGSAHTAPPLSRVASIQEEDEGETDSSSEGEGLNLGGLMGMVLGGLGIHTNDKDKEKEHKEKDHKEKEKSRKDKDRDKEKRDRNDSSSDESKDDPHNFV